MKYLLCANAHEKSIPSTVDLETEFRSTVFLGPCSRIRLSLEMAGAA